MKLDGGSPKVTPTPTPVAAPAPAPFSEIQHSRPISIARSIAAVITDAFHPRKAPYLSYDRAREIADMLGKIGWEKDIVALGTEDTLGNKSDPAVSLLKSRSTSGGLREEVLERVHSAMQDDSQENAVRDFKLLASQLEQLRKEQANTVPWHKQKAEEIVTVLSTFNFENPKIRKEDGSWTEMAKSLPKDLADIDITRYKPAHAAWALRLVPGTMSQMIADQIYLSPKVQLEDDIAASLAQLLQAN